jgi:hypothetical protein
MPKNVALLTTIPLLCLAALAWSWIAIRGPRVGQAILLRGYWPDGERMFWIFRIGDNMEVPSSPWLYGVLLIFIGMWSRVFGCIAVCAGIAALMSKLS